MDFLSCSLRPMMNNVFNFFFVIVVITERIINLRECETMDFGDFFGVFARLKEQDDMTHPGASSLNNRLPTVNGGIMNNIGMRGSFYAHHSVPFFICV